jgi:hypothetical protein
MGVGKVWGLACMAGYLSTPPQAEGPYDSHDFEHQYFERSHGLLPEQLK